MKKKLFIKASFNKYSFVSGIITGVLGLIVLLGWQFKSYTMETFGLGGVTMKVNTAISFLLAGISLILLQIKSNKWNYGLIRLLSIIIVSLSIISLAQDAYNVNLGIDQFIYHDVKNAADTIYPGRMAPNTSINFVFIGTVIFLLSFLNLKYRFPALFLIILSLCISIVGLLGYITDLMVLTGIPSFTKIAFNTSVTFLILCIGIGLTIFKDKKEPISIESKLFAGLTIALSIIIYTSYISVTSIQSTVKTFKLVDESNYKKEKIELIKSTFLEEIANTRGYLITGEEVYSNLSEKINEELLLIVNDLTKLYYDNQKQQQNILYLKSLINKREEYSKLLINTFKLKGETNSNALFASRKDLILDKEIFSIISNMIIVEDSELKARKLNQAKQADRTELINILAICFQFMLLLLIYLIVKKDSIGRKNAEMHLIESEELFRHVFEYSTIGNSLTHIDGGLSVNQEFCNITGYSKEELSKINWKDITHPDDIEESQIIISDLLAGKIDRARYQKRYIHKSGRIVWTDVSTSLRKDKDGKPLHFLTLINDITDLKNYEESIKKMNEELELRVKERTNEINNRINEYKFLSNQFEAIIDHIPGLIFYKDTNNNYLHVNKFLADAHKTTKEKLENKSCYELYSEREAQAHFEDDLIVINSGKPKLYFEELREIDNELRWFNTSKIPFVNEDGKISGVIGISFDITESKKANQEIRKLNETLEEKVLERTHQLEAVNKELESFAYSVSHDLRAPLRAIDGFSNLILKKYYNTLNDEGKDFFNRIKNASQKMGNLIDDILKLSRTTRSEINKKEFDISALATSISNELKEINSEKNIKFIIQDHLTAFGDLQLISIVLQNLFINAVKFSAIKSEQIIEFGRIEKNGEKYFFVKDNGIGFQMQFADKLFGAFQRLHDSRDFEGNGIGLATVKRIINKHNGMVWADSEVDNGATFYFSL